MTSDRRELIGNLSLQSQDGDSSSKHGNVIGTTEGGDLPGTSGCTCIICSKEPQPDLQVKHPKRTGDVCRMLAGLYGLFIIVAGGVITVSEVLLSSKKYMKPVYSEGYFAVLYTMSSIFLFLALVTNMFELNNSTKTHSASLYLRISHTIFAVSAISSIVDIGRHFDHDCSPENELFLASPIAYLIFILLEVAFVITKSNVCCKQFNGLAKFGTMHVMATNICLWFKTIISETVEDMVKEVERQVAKNLKNKKSVDPSFISEAWCPSCENQNMTNLTANVCATDQSWGEFQEEASPWLYPCRIELCLIGAGLMVVVFNNIGGKCVECQDTAGPTKKTCSIDASNSTVGFLFGLLIALIGVFVVIFFSIYHAKDGALHHRALLVYQGYLVCMYSVIIMLTSVALACMRSIPYDSKRVSSLDSNLLVISLVGIYIFDVFNILSGLIFTFGDAPRNWAAESFGDDHPINLTITQASLQLIQTTLQTVFLLDGLGRQSAAADNETPGFNRTSIHVARQITVFLIICNIVLWLMSIYEVKKPDTTPVAKNLYEYASWCIISHIAMPMVIFYRFHSAACTFEIWTEAFKMRI